MSEGWGGGVGRAGLRLDMPFSVGPRASVASDIEIAKIQEKVINRIMNFFLCVLKASKGFKME